MSDSRNHGYPTARAKANHTDVGFVTLALTCDEHHYALSSYLEKAAAEPGNETSIPVDLFEGSLRNK
jgi:hypothetical protein